MAAIKGLSSTGGRCVKAWIITRRFLHATGFRHRSKFNQPLNTDDMPRAGGIATMMRLPLQENQPEGLDACFVGIPTDSGSSFRSGARHGPRAIRSESTVLRPCNVKGAVPFESLQVADIGDVPVNIYNLHKTVDIITNYYRRIVEANCTPLTLGGDHSITYPILRAVREKYGPVGLIQVDAHADLADTMFGERYNHGTVFRRALEAKLIDPSHMILIGFREAPYGKEDFDDTVQWARRQGVRVIFAEQCWHKSLAPLMESVQEQMGDMPVYITFDIDGIDPAFCPGTGFPESGGLLVTQGLEIIQGCRQLNIVGADVVEVNPLFDHSGATALTAANLLFELLCVLPGVKYVDIG